MLSQSAAKPSLLNPQPCVRSAKAHVLSQFAAAGIDTARVDLLPLAAANSNHLGTYAHMDISLDPFPYAGTTTTCESLYMGVPVVTLQGVAMISMHLTPCFCIGGPQFTVPFR